MGRQHGFDQSAPDPGSASPACPPSPAAQGAPGALAEPAGMLPAPGALGGWDRDKEPCRQPAGMLLVPGALGGWDRDKEPCRDLAGPRPGAAAGAGAAGFPCREHPGFSFKIAVITRTIIITITAIIVTIIALKFLARVFSEERLKT